MTVAEFAYTILAFLFLVATGYTIYKHYKKHTTDSVFDIVMVVVVVIGWFLLITIGFKYALEHIDWDSKLF